MEKAILMSTHNMCFYGELTKIILQLSSNTHLICSTQISGSPWYYPYYVTITEPGEVYETPKTEYVEPKPAKKPKTPKIVQKEKTPEQLQLTQQRFVKSKWLCLVC